MRDQNFTRYFSFQRHRISASVLVVVSLVMATLIAAPPATAQVDFSCEVSTATPGSRTVTWTAVPNAVSYQYKLSAAGVGNRYRTVSGTSAQIDVPEGTSIAIYMAPRFADSTPSRILCVDNSNDGPTPTPAPSQPNPSQPAPNNPAPGTSEFSCQTESVVGGIKLSWSRVSGTSGYQYKWSVGSGPNRYVRITGNSVNSRLLPVPPSQTAKVSMAPQFTDGTRISRVACDTDSGPSSPSNPPNDASTPKQCVGPSDNNNFPGLQYGSFLLMNNAWNAQVSNGDWSQCIELIQDGSGVRPQWTYNWLHESAVIGPVWQVKAYPEIIYGTKSLFEVSGSKAETGLPALYPQIPQFNIDYAYTSTETETHSKEVGGKTVYGEKNVAFETFFHTNCQIQRGVSGSNREYEIMVWVEGGPERKPDGAAGLKTTTTINGRSYQVWTKGAKDPGYIAFYALDPQTSGSLDWNAFIEWARANGETYGTKAFNDNWCMGNILFGTEIWWGEGTFRVDRLDIRKS